MDVIQIIDKKRRGETHTEAEIRWLIQQMMTDCVADYQLSAWLMAVCTRGLTLDETTWLTDAYVQSGATLDLSGIDGVVVDKHSTGGVGDKTTLALIPLLAVCGVKVAKLSGRGLGFTGGTVDKLEAIPGFHVALSNEQFFTQIQRIGVAISSQTPDLAPADAKLYALRDVTATVESIPLIAASVVSKKIAAGAQVIVLDIKCGRGAFMKNEAEARALAQSCREVGQRLGRSIATVISGMDQPLGFAIGHSVEVIETIQLLQGKGPADLLELCLTLGAQTLIHARKAQSVTGAEQILKRHIADGSALEKFRELIQAQGGDDRILEDVTLLPQSRQIIPVLSTQSGYIAAIDSLQIARAAKLLGAGRTLKTDQLDLGVGVVLKAKVGNAIQAGQPLLDLYVGQKDPAEAIALAQQAFTISADPVSQPELILEIG